MKCFSHSDSEAIAICIHCGRGVCVSCQIRSPTGRIVCSTTCLSGLRLTEQAIDGLRNKTISGASFSGYFFLVSGLVMAIFAFVPIRGRIVWHIASLLLVFAVIFIGAGIGFIRIAKRKEINERDA
jgi:Uncharacterized protein conserved in archaea (DUF2180)